MIFIAIGFFTLAALLGLYLLSFVLQGKDTPKAIAFIHGPLGALGILTLIVYCLLYDNKPIASLIIFLVAATGGFYLLWRDLTGQGIPKAYAIGHGSIALLGFLFLLYFAFV